MVLLNSTPTCLQVPVRVDQHGASTLPDKSVSNPLPPWYENRSQAAGCPGAHRRQEEFGEQDDSKPGETDYDDDARTTG